MFRECDFRVASAAIDQMVQSRLHFLMFSTFKVSEICRKKAKVTAAYLAEYLEIQNYFHDSDNFSAD